MNKFHSAPLTAVKLADKFFAPGQQQSFSVTIPSALAKCEETGRIEAFKLSWKEGAPNRPHIFWDSDVAKVLEGMAYSLALKPDAEAEKVYDDLVDLIASSQQPDGYLNSAITTDKQQGVDNRWKNLGSNHELYCAGHLMEAAVAGFEALGKRKLLDVMCRYADYIDSVFGYGDGKRYGIPGHPEIELALVKLYRATGNEKYLRLSKYFIDARGDDPEFFYREVTRATSLSYLIADMPVREQQEVYAHAVRALYLLCGMADVAAETDDEPLLAACRRLFRNIVDKRMYITGGVGTSFDTERFTVDYDLPNDTRGYSESCANMALALFCRRMLDITGEKEYADVMERVLYNGALSGIDRHGDRFFYPNYLEVNDNFVQYHAGRKIRQPWFNCSCCPTSYSRFLPQLGLFMWSVNDDLVRLEIPAAGKLALPGRTVEVCGNYPFDDKFTVKIGSCGKFKLAIRIPGFAKSVSFMLNGEMINMPAVDGYAVFDRQWCEGDEIICNLGMPFEFIRSHRKVTMNRGKVAVMRGPVVYCCENTDNPGDVSSLFAAAGSKFIAKELPDGYPAAEFDGFMEKLDGEELYTNKVPEYVPCRITAIPYALWQNRGETNMNVWLPEML
ncbi:MAG: glycoside hydrolase family 127 protein [Lentisphaeria bacterium]|nr:glycoside hydrolase family 127 protein [Lentisphaeria bacterium]